MLFRLSPESGEFAVERFGFSQGFLELSTGRSGCTQKRVDSLKEVFRPQAKRTEDCRKLFLTEIVGFVDGMEDLDKSVNGSCQATGDEADLPPRRGLGGILKRESCRAEARLHAPLLYLISFTTTLS